jgi:hypothetical protein
MKNAQGDDELGDVIADPSAVEPAAAAIQALLPHEIARLLAPLGERERLILSMRFGLDHGDPQTLDQIGERLNLTRERILVRSAAPVRLASESLRLTEPRAGQADRSPRWATGSATALPIRVPSPQPASGWPSRPD